MKNIDADEIRRSPFWDDQVTFQWLKSGQVVHELTVTARQYLEQQYAWCDACLMWRGELVEVSLEHRSGFRQCPACKGLSIPEHLCTCGEIPHRVSCPMGFHLYIEPVKKLTVEEVVNGFKNNYDGINAAWRKRR